MSDHRPRCGGSVEALLFLARVAHFCTPSVKREASETPWLQCDSCFRWRRDVTLSFNGVCHRWTCADADRTCSDPCDHCLSTTCSCTMSESYSGYCTRGYSLPEGFSVTIRFRHAAEREIGTPWLSYRSQCAICGEVSVGMDRRDYMQKWLQKHCKHNAKWSSLTVDAFDFKVDQRVRDWYATYTRLHKRGVLKGGIRHVVHTDSPLITNQEKDRIKSLLQIVEASQFFNEAVPSAHARSRPGRKKRLKTEISDPKASLSASMPKKRAKRKAKQPDWMRRSDQWLIDDIKNAIVEDSVPHVRQESVKKEDNSAATNVSVDKEVMELMEKAELVLAERLLCGNVTKRKDKQSLICDVMELDGGQSMSNVCASDSGGIDQVFQMPGEQTDRLNGGWRSLPANFSESQSVDRQPAASSLFQQTTLFSVNGGFSPLLTPPSRNTKNACHYLDLACSTVQDSQFASSFVASSRTKSVQKR